MTQIMTMTYFISLLLSSLCPVGGLAALLKVQGFPSPHTFFFFDNFTGSSVLRYLVFGCRSPKNRTAFAI